MEICDYGCGKEAKYIFKNGKKCCSKNHKQCSEKRHLNYDYSQKPSHIYVMCKYCNNPYCLPNINRHESSCYLNPKNIKKYIVCEAILKQSNKFCSTSCAAKFNNLHRKHSEATKKKISDSCKNYFLESPSHQKILVKKVKTKKLLVKKVKTKKLKDRVLSGDGRWFIIPPKEYKGKKYIKNLYVCEHRYLMEQQLGRLLLTDEIVHHIDGNKLNNELNNLELMSRSDHSSHHGKKKLKRMVKLKCICGKIFERERRKTHITKKYGKITCCSRNCSAKLSYMEKQKFEEYIIQNVIEEFVMSTCS